MAIVGASVSARLQHTLISTWPKRGLDAGQLPISSSPTPDLLNAMANCTMMVINHRVLLPAIIKTCYIHTLTCTPDMS